MKEYLVGGYRLVRDGVRILGDYFNKWCDAYTKTVRVDAGFLSSKESRLEKEASR